MNVIEGVYRNPNTGIDERYVLVCDAEGRLITTVSNRPVDVFDIGALPINENFTSPVIDLGEGHPYALLIVRKAGLASANENLTIETSVDGSRWLPAAGIGFINGPAYYQAGVGAANILLKGHPTGRFARVVYNNGGTAQTDLVIEFAALVTGA